MKARNVRNAKKNNNFSVVAIAHWPFRLGLAAAAFDFALTRMGGLTARRIVVLLSFVALLRKIKSMFSAKIFIALMPGIHHSPHGGKLNKNSKLRKYASTSFPAFGAAQHSLQICCDFVRCQVLVFQRTAAKSAVKLRNLGTIENYQILTTVCISWGRRSEQIVGHIYGCRLL